MKRSAQFLLELTFAVWVAAVFCLYFRQFWNLFANRLSALWSLWS